MLEIPTWFLKIVFDVLRARKRGSLTMNFCDGGIANVEVREVVHPPKK